MQTTKIAELSEGQKSRLVFGMICMQRPNLLLLDEPTNHLDLESIDALADAIKAYKGGLVLVSHDFRLIDQVCRSFPPTCCTAPGAGLLRVMFILESMSWAMIFVMMS